MGGWSQASTHSLQPAPRERGRECCTAGPTEKHSESELTTPAGSFCLATMNTAPSTIIEYTDSTPIKMK